jgi:hypothetical protein
VYLPRDMFTVASMCDDGKWSVDASTIIERPPL